MPTPAPTSAELAILQVLWRDGPCTVRRVHEQVYGAGGAGYTSALKLMQNMLAKGLVSRADDARTHVYAAAVSERPTLNHLVRGIIDGAFGGSPAALAMQALDAGPLSAEDVARLREVLARIDAQQK